MEQVRRFLRCQRGATAIECAVLAGLVLLACITAVMLFAQRTATTSPEPQLPPNLAAPSEAQ